MFRLHNGAGSGQGRVHGNQRKRPYSQRRFYGLVFGHCLRLKVDYYRVLVRISFLAPDIVAAILEGRQPVTLSRQKLARMTDLPLEWQAQRRMLGFADQLRDAA